MDQNMYWEQVPGLVNSIVLKDKRYPWRMLDAKGDAVVFRLKDIYRAADFTVTATGTSPVTNGVLPGTAMLITTENVDFAGDNIQALGTRFQFATNKPFYFGFWATASDATQSDLLVGLCGTDTTLTAASSAHAIAVSAGGIFFSKIDGSTSILAKTYTTSTEKNSAAAGTLTTAERCYEFYGDGKKVDVYLDTVLVATFTTDITTEVVTPSLCFRAGEAGAKTLTVKDWIAVQVNS